MLDSNTETLYAVQECVCLNGSGAGDEWEKQKSMLKTCLISSCLLLSLRGILNMHMSDVSESNTHIHKSDRVVAHIVLFSIVVACGQVQSNCDDVCHVSLCDIQRCFVYM